MMAPILIVGAGAVGCYFGGLLAAGGAEVTFLARGATLEALRETDVRLSGPRGEITARVHATADLRGHGPFDVALLCVKQYDTVAAANGLRDSLSCSGICISLQNGVEAHDLLAPILGPQRVMPGLAYMSGVIQSPGHVVYTSAMSSIIFGAIDGTSPAVAHRFVEQCSAAGFEARLSTNIRVDQWTKLVVLATNAALTALSRLPAGPLYHDPLIEPHVVMALREVEAVARACGVQLADDVVPQSLRLLRSFPPDMYASMYHDLVKGRHLELESFSGKIVTLAAEHGIPTPIHGLAYALLRPYSIGK